MVVIVCVEIFDAYRRTYKVPYDRASLRAYTNDGTKDICQLPRNGAGEQTVRQLIMYICTKNPNIKVGYK